MPEIINIQSATQADIDLEAVIIDDQLVIRYAGQAQDSFTINCDNNLSARIRIRHIDLPDGTRWLVSANPATRIGAAWAQTEDGIIDAGPNPDTTGTGGSQVTIVVYADPPAGSQAERKKKTIKIDIRPQVPLPDGIS